MANITAIIITPAYIGIFHTSSSSSSFGSMFSLVVLVVVGAVGDVDCVSVDDVTENDVIVDVVELSSTNVSFVSINVEPVGVVDVWFSEVGDVLVKFKVSVMVWFDVVGDVLVTFVASDAVWFGA